jgi:hypothetical protein
MQNFSSQSNQCVGNHFPITDLEHRGGIIGAFVWPGKSSGFRMVATLGSRLVATLRSVRGMRTQSRRPRRVPCCPRVRGVPRRSTLVLHGHLVSRGSWRSSSRRCTARGVTTPRRRVAASWWSDLDGIRDRHLARRANDHHRVRVIGVGGNQERQTHDASRGVCVGSAPESSPALARGLRRRTSCGRR